MAERKLLRLHLLARSVPFTAWLNSRVFYSQATRQRAPHVKKRYDTPTGSQIENRKPGKIRITPPLTHPHHCPWISSRQFLKSSSSLFMSQVPIVHLRTLRPFLIFQMVIDSICFIALGLLCGRTRLSGN